MNRLWLVIDRNGNWWLPSDCRLVLLDLDQCDPRWYSQLASEWPSNAILHSNTLGLVTADYERRHQ